MHEGGRPSIFTQELADRICAELAEGNSMRTVCSADDMPDTSTVFRWLRTNEQFRNQYARAKEESSDAMAEELLDIVDDGTNDWMEYNDKDGNNIGWKLNGEHVQRSRLRADTRKWLMAKMKPKKYGDKIDMTTNGKDLPTPILGNIHVQSHDGNTPDIKTNETNQSDTGGNISE